MFWRYLIALGVYGHVSTCLASSDCVLPDHPAGGKWELVSGKPGFPGDKVDANTALAYTCDGDIVPSYIVPCSSTVQLNCKGRRQKRGIFDYLFGSDEQETSSSEQPLPKQNQKPRARDPYASPDGSQLEIRGGNGGSGLVIEDYDTLRGKNAVGIGGRGGDVVLNGWPDYDEPTTVVRGGKGRAGVIASGDSTWDGSIVAVGGRGGDAIFDGTRRSGSQPARRRPPGDRTLVSSDESPWGGRQDALIGVGGRGQDVRVLYKRSTRQKRQKEIKLTQSKTSNGHSGSIKQSAYGRLDGPGRLKLSTQGHISVGQDGVLVEGDVFGDAEDFPDWAKDLLNQNGMGRRRRSTSKSSKAGVKITAKGEDGEDVTSNGRSIVGGKGADGLALKTDVDKTIVEGHGGRGGNAKVDSKKNGVDGEVTVVRGGRGGQGVIFRGNPNVGGVVRATGGRGGDAILIFPDDPKPSKGSNKGRKDEVKPVEAKGKNTKQTGKDQQGTGKSTRRSRRQIGYPPNQRYVSGPGKSLVIQSGDQRYVRGPDGTTVYKDGFQRVVKGPDGTILYRNNVPDNFQDNASPRDPYLNNAYPNQNGGYPNNGGYHNQNGGYPNQDGGYYNQDGVYFNQNDADPNKNGGNRKVSKKGNTNIYRDGDQNGGFEIKHTKSGPGTFEQEVSVSSSGKGRISARLGGSLAAGRNGEGFVSEESVVSRSGGRGGRLTTQDFLRLKRAVEYLTGADGSTTIKDGTRKLISTPDGRLIVRDGARRYVHGPDGDVVIRSGDRKVYITPSGRYVIKNGDQSYQYEGGFNENLRQKGAAVRKRFVGRARGGDGGTGAVVREGVIDDDLAGKPRPKRQSRYAGTYRSYRNQIRRRPVISGDYESLGGPDAGEITRSNGKVTYLGGIGMGGITELKLNGAKDDEDDYEDDVNEDDRVDDRLNTGKNSKKNKKKQGGTGTSTKLRSGGNCPIYLGDEYTRVSCYHNKRIIDCDKTRTRSSFNYTCSPFCEPFNRTYETGYCFDGDWTVPEPKCVPICGKKRTNAQVLVVNGKTAVLNDYPWVAAVFKVNQGDEQNVCGGTMLTRKVILTAAHCVTDLYGNKYPNERIKVGLGKHYNEYNDPRDPMAQYSGVEQILTHKYYKGINQHYANDVAMLVTIVRFDLMLTVQPICFRNLPSFELVNDMRGIVTGWGFNISTGPSADELQQLVVPFKEDETCRLEYNIDWLDKHLSDDKFCAGFYNKRWGYTESSGTPSVELKELFVPYKDNRACQADFPLDWLDDFLTKDKFCAGFTYKSTSVCKGDSGGGLIFPYNNRFYVQGIVSLGNNPSEGECQIQKSSLYTRVASHYDWIVEVTTLFN